MCTSESSVKELKQYGRRLCHHIASVPVVENEVSEDVFNNILDICKKGNISTSKNDIDCMFRIGKPYVDNISKKTLQIYNCEIHLFSQAHTGILQKKKYERC